MVYLNRGESENPGFDLSLGAHAFFGLLWLVLGFLQIVPVRKAGLHLHRKFGYLAIAAFFMHMWASIYHLLFDEAQHIMINRFFYQCVFSSL